MRPIDWDSHLFLAAAGAAGAGRRTEIGDCPPVMIRVRRGPGCGQAARLSRSEFSTTEIELSIMAAVAKAGGSGVKIASGSITRL